MGEHDGAASLVRSDALLAFPSWEDACSGITDSRFVGHPKITREQTNRTKDGARIMYDRLYVMLANAGLDRQEEAR